MSDIYNICDIVVLPSRLDNLPNVALEAQSCGKPLIAYNVGGLSDIITNNYNGFLIEPFNHVLFSKKLQINFKGFDEKFKYGFEYDLLCYLTKNYIGIHLNNFLSCFRITKFQLSSNKELLKIEFNKILVNYNLEYSNSIILRIIFHINQNSFSRLIFLKYLIF